MKEPAMAPTAEESRKLPTLAPGEIFASRYRVEKKLGQGIFGETYHVRHVKYNQNLVLKLFYPGLFPSEEERTAFKTEFDRVKPLKHPGICRYLEQGDIPELNTRYATMEYINGSSLRALMTELKKQGRQFSALDAVQILTKLLETLKEVHAAGMSHRNIKPENVLIVAKGKAADKVQWDVRLSDFALGYAPADWMTEISNEKLPYVAPELQGFGDDVGPRADIFSVGAIFYEMLLGAPPEGAPVPPTSKRPSLPKKLDDVIELCLAQSASDRYASAQDLLFDLGQLPANLPIEEEQAPRRWWVPVLVVAGVVLLGAVIGFILFQDPNKGEIQGGPERWAKMRDKVKAEHPAEPAEQMASKAGKEPNMIYVPAGGYLSGALPGEPNASPLEPPAKIIELPGFYIDIYEFPNRKDAKPAARRTWDEAEDACNKLGKRLCTAVEWERACKGPEFWIYSYGDDYNPAACPPVDKSGVPKTGSAPDCKSAYGVYDLSGGLPEWVNAAPEGQPALRLVKGGVAGGNALQGTRCAAFLAESAGIQDPLISFRCCK